MTRIFFATPSFEAFLRTSPQISRSAELPKVLSFLHVSSPDRGSILTLAFKSSGIKSIFNSIPMEYQVSKPWIWHHVSTVINGLDGLQPLRVLDPNFLCLESSRVPSLHTMRSISIYPLLINGEDLLYSLELHGFHLHHTSFLLNFELVNTTISFSRLVKQLI